MRASIATILMSATLLAGCGGTRNRGLESVHQPVVSRSEYALDLNAGPDGLAAGERERLSGWLAALRVGYGDRLSVDTQDGQVREDVANEADRYGLLLADATPVAVAPGTVRVVLSRTTATVPGCPDHSRTYQPNFGQHTSSDYGCAVNSNLASMVAQPEDLVRGRTAGVSTDPITATKPVQALREKKPQTDQQLQTIRTTNAGAQ